MKRRRLTALTKEAIPLALVILVWEAVSRAGLVPVYLLPSPTQVLHALLKLCVEGVLWAEYLATLRRVAVGFVLGSVAGVLLGLLTAYLPWARRITQPLAALFASIPAVALVPLLMVWVGLNEGLPIATVFLCSFPPALYNTLSGARCVDRDMVEVAKTLGAGETYIIRTIVLPQALPSILSALKLEAAMAWRTCFVAELVAVSSGLGYLMMEAEAALRVDVMLATLLLLTLSCHLFQESIEQLEKSLTGRWGMSRA